MTLTSSLLLSVTRPRAPHLTPIIITFSSRYKYRVCLDRYDHLSPDILDVKELKLSLNFLFATVARLKQQLLLYNQSTVFSTTMILAYYLLFLFRWHCFAFPLDHVSSFCKDFIIYDFIDFFAK
jgi:hypothetical protein